MITVFNRKNIYVGFDLKKYSDIRNTLGNMESTTPPASRTVWGNGRDRGTEHSVDRQEAWDNLRT